MKMLYVYADFDWLKEVEFVGELAMNLFGAQTVIYKSAMNG